MTVPFSVHDYDDESIRAFKGFEVRPCWDDGEMTDSYPLDNGLPDDLSGCFWTLYGIDSEGLSHALVDAPSANTLWHLLMLDDRISTRDVHGFECLGAAASRGLSL